jgi:sigma-B regulation protein RsbU (phosphoserine phosphatase)
VTSQLTALRWLVEDVDRARPDDLPRVATRVGRELGAIDMILYLADYEQTVFVPFTATSQVAGEHGAVAAGPDEIRIDGTLAGRAYTTGRVLDTAVDGQHHVWIPLVDGSDRIGVIQVVAPTVPDSAGIETYRTVASLFAKVLVTRRLYGDAIERCRRRLPMQLAAEIIWTQLPPLTFATGDVAISAILEPCYDVGGDAFDYAVNGTTLHIAMFDAVGHGIGACATTSLALSAYRNARRLGLDLTDTYRSIDKWVSVQHPDGFLTAILGELAYSTGIYRRISAGHPGELLLRDGALVHPLAAPTAMPLGLGQLGDPIPDVTETILEPGDNLLFYTDGVTEARTDTGEFFGTERLIAFVTRALADLLPTSETMRRLIHAILQHQHERLQDDASAALLTFRPAVMYGDEPR